MAVTPFQERAAALASPLPTGNTANLAAVNGRGVFGEDLTLDGFALPPELPAGQAAADATAVAVAPASQLRSSQSLQRQQQQAYQQQQPSGGMQQWYAAAQQQQPQEHQYSQQYSQQQQQQQELSQQLMQQQQYPQQYSQQYAAPMGTPSQPLFQAASQQQQQLSFQLPMQQPMQQQWGAPQELPRPIAPPISFPVSSNASLYVAWFSVCLSEPEPSPICIHLPPPPLILPFSLASPLRSSCNWSRSVSSTTCGAAPRSSNRCGKCGYHCMSSHFSALETCTYRAPCAHTSACVRTVMYTDTSRSLTPGS